MGADVITASRGIKFLACRYLQYFYKYKRVPLSLSEVGIFSSLTGDPVVVGSSLVIYTKFRSLFVETVFS